VTVRHLSSGNRFSLIIHRPLSFPHPPLVFCFRFFFFLFFGSPFSFLPENLFPEFLGGETVMAFRSSRPLTYVCRKQPLRLLFLLPSRSLLFVRSLFFVLRLPSTQCPGPVFFAKHFSAAHRIRFLTLLSPWRLFFALNVEADYSPPPLPPLKPTLYVLKHIHAL